MKEYTPPKLPPVKIVNVRASRQKEKSYTINLSDTTKDEVFNTLKTQIEQEAKPDVFSKGNALRIVIRERETPSMQWEQGSKTFTAYGISVKDVERIVKSLLNE